MNKHLLEHASQPGSNTFLDLLKTEITESRLGEEPGLPPTSQSQEQLGAYGWLADGEASVAGCFSHQQKSVAEWLSQGPTKGKKPPRRRGWLALTSVALLLATPGSAPLASSSAPPLVGLALGDAPLSGVPALPEGQSPFGLSAGSYSPEQVAAPLPLIVVSPVAGAGPAEEAVPQALEGSQARVEAGEGQAVGETIAPGPSEAVATESGPVSDEPLAVTAEPASVPVAEQAPVRTTETPPVGPGEAPTSGAVAEAGPDTETAPVRASEVASAPQAAPVARAASVPEALATEAATLALVADLEARVEDLAASNAELALKLEQAQEQLDARSLPRPPVSTELPSAPWPFAVPTEALPAAEPQQPALLTTQDYLNEQVALGLLADTAADAGFEQAESGEVLELRETTYDGEVVKTIRLGASGPESVVIAATLEHPAEELAASLKRHLDNLYGSPESGSDGLAWATGAGTVRLAAAGNTLTLTFLRRYTSTFGFGD